MSYDVTIKTRVDLDENKNYVLNKYVVATVDFSLDASHETYKDDEFDAAIDAAIAEWNKNEATVAGALIETSFAK